MTKVIGRIRILTLLLGTYLMSAIVVSITMAIPIESYHKEGGSCENVRTGLSLNLRDVGLRRLDSGFINSPHISCLNLEDNEIAYVSPNSFNLLPNLLYLNLTRNNLSLMNFSKLDRHVKLRILVLDENPSTEYVNLEFLNTFPDLAYLHLRNCSVGDIVSLSFAPGLAYLNLSTNSLGTSELAFLNDAPLTLTALDLSDNDIKNINVSSLSSVTTLRLDGNQFKRLCGKSYCNEAALVLEGATSLEWFSVSRNALTSVDSDAFDNSVNIAYLDLSENKIDSIQKGTFEKLEKLKYLFLKGNILKTIPELCNLDSLRHLYLAKNYLQAVTKDAFCQIENLTYVDLSDNQIKFIQVGALDRLTRLEVLKLSNNLLATFPNSWLERLKQLQLLYVDANKLNSLSDLGLGSVNMFAKLKQVFLQNNLIDRLYTATLHSEVRNNPNVTIQLFDFDKRTPQTRETVPIEGACKCDRSDDNDLS